MVLITKEIIRKYTKTPGERNDIDEIVSPVLFAHRIFGTQILEPNWSWKKYSPYLIFQFLVTIYVGVGNFYFAKDNLDFNTITEVILCLSVVVVYPIKLSILAYQRTLFQTGYVINKTTFLDMIKNLAPEKIDSIKKQLRLFVILLFGFVTIPVGGFMSTSLWHNLNGSRATLSRTTSTLLPMSTPYFEICFIIHLYFLCSSAFNIIVVDFWFVFLIFIYCEICDCVVKVLKVQKTGITPYEIRLNDALRKFYKIHVIITGYLDSVQDIFKWLILLPMTAVTEIICLFLLTIKTSESFNMQLVSVLLPTIAEIFAYCCLGEYIKTKANDIRVALLNFDWTSMRVKDQKSYLIIFCYINKDVSIKSAIGIDLSLLTMSSIFKMSYQVFTVINTMEI